MTVRRRDGIHFEVDPYVIADSRRAFGEVTVVSHAHADHTFRSVNHSDTGADSKSGGPTIVCSTETAAIVTSRTGMSFDHVESAAGIELVPAGHVVGSRAALFADETGRRYCYTGDFSVRDRAYLTGFDPTTIDADVLVMETTYGQERYRFPPYQELETQVHDWLADNDDRPLFLFGYSLGRAQKLQWIAREEATSGRDVLVFESIHRVNRAIETATGRQFPGQPYEERSALRRLTNEIVILPSNHSRADWVRHLVEQTDGLTAGFSGWAVDQSYQYRGGYDVTFPLTDHADFDDLVETVLAIDPEVVYTHHGFSEGFADHLVTQYGYRASPLLRNQRTLDEFGLDGDE